MSDKDTKGENIHSHLYDVSDEKRTFFESLALFNEREQQINFIRLSQEQEEVLKEALEMYIRNKAPGIPSFGDERTKQKVCYEKRALALEILNQTTGFYYGK